MKPCGECPWRTASTPGWLGPWTAEDFYDALGQTELACHTKAPDHVYPLPVGKNACAGALIAMKNSGTLPREKRHADMLSSVEASDTVFSHRHFFLQHHGAHL